MVFNGDKFELLRFGPGKTAKLPNHYKDYCTQLWIPSNQGSISLLEGITKSFTA